jgi:hypothetical protein
MSKIELTDQQGERLRNVFSVPRHNYQSFEAVANELIAMGLVRPASDDPMQREWEDVKARVAALEAKVNAPAPVYADAFGPIKHPDPHAAAKERAKLWGVELVKVSDGTWLFFAGHKHYWAAPSMTPKWWEHGSRSRTTYVCGYKNPSEAWSNFPTEPPPGWEAPKDNGFGDNDSWTGPAEPKPRTEADRLEVLGEVAYEADRIEGSGPWSSLSDKGRESWRKKALAVRKADRAAQLEPSEEEIDKACNAYEPHYAASTPSFVESVRRGVTAALTAAARVRLEKAEGEKP